MFSFTQLAGSYIMNIRTLGTVSHVWMHTGSATLADILVEGYTFDIFSGSSTQLIKNIQVVPLQFGNTFLSGNVMIQNNGYPFEYAISLRNTTALDPELLVGINAMKGFGSTFHSAMVLSGAGTQGSVTKIPLNVGGNESIEVYESWVATVLCVIDDDTAYSTYENNDLKTYYLMKVNFCSGNATVADSWSTEGTFGGEAIHYTGVLEIVRCKHGALDCLVIIEVWDREDYTYSSVVGVTIYDLQSETTVYHGLIEATSEGYHMQWLGTMYPPITYQDKVVFSIYLNVFDEDEHGTPPNLPNSVCPFPTFVVDCTSKSVARIDDYKVDPNNVWPDFSYVGACIDRTTGIYYFWLDDFSGPDGTSALMQIVLSTSTTSVVSSGLSYDALIRQGDITGYAITYENPSNLRSIPGLAVLGTYTNQIPYYGENIAVDYINRCVWIYDDDQLYGIKFNGDTTTIPINWSGGSTPYEYENSQRVYLWILSGNAYVLVQSSYGGSTQKDLYLLRRRITCS